MAEQNKPVKILGMAPALVADGHGLGTDTNNKVANLAFFQLSPNQNPEQAKELEGNVVANIRLSFEQLQRLNEDITRTLKDTKQKSK